MDLIDLMDYSSNLEINLCLYQKKTQQQVDLQSY